MVASKNQAIIIAGHILRFLEARLFNRARLAPRVLSLSVIRTVQAKYVTYRLFLKNIFYFIQEEAMFRFKVRFFQDNIWEVYSINPNTYEEIESSLYQGSLSDCEAWIRLEEGGYMS